MRRLRQNDALRTLVRETTVTPKDLIAPLFTVSGKGIKNPITSLPGQFQFSADCIAEEANQLQRLGIPAVLLFGIPAHKDEKGSSALAADGVVQQATAAIKKNVNDLLVIADLCFCEYTSHGHCGVLKDNDVDNDATLRELQKQAVSLAKAGVDIIAPSGMMDGCVHAVRQALDENGFHSLSILSYSAKFASAYYGPFREAVDSSPSFGDRCSYQMDPANAREALREIELDIAEGADIVMVKPALPYLDIITRARERFDVPLAAYNVSGEYAMVKAAAEKGLIDGDRVMRETLLSIKRAGADMIISYFAKEFAQRV